MMCSNWKISVFGIVALMLAFGLATTDALAQTEYSPVTVEVTARSSGDSPVIINALRAADVVDITFVINTTAIATADPTGTITITIPSGWSRAFMTSDTLDTLEPARDQRAGAIIAFDSADTNADDADDITLDARGNRLIATVKKDVIGSTITWHYRNVKLPASASTYAFGVHSTIHGGLPRLDPSTIIGDVVSRTETTKGDGRNIVLAVGSVANGMGKFVLTSPSFPKGNDKYKSGEGETSTYNYEKHNLVYAGQALGNLVFTFTAAGTMYKGSTVTLVLPGGTLAEGTTVNTLPIWIDPEKPLRNENNDGVADQNEVSVSGADIDDALTTESTVTAKLGATRQAGHPIRFTVKNVKAPKVEGITQVTAAFVAQMNSLVAVDGDDAGTAAKVGDTVYFTVYGTHGDNSHKVAVDDLSMSRTGDAEANLMLTFTSGGVMLEGSVVEIMVPAGWMPSPYINIIGDTNPAGHVAVESDGGALSMVKVSNRSIIITLASKLAKDSTLTATYYAAKAPKTQRSYTFSSKASSHKQATPMPITSPTISVITGHGSGTIALNRGGAAFARATRKTNVGTLTFIYSPAGLMPTGSVIRISWPNNWSAPRNDNADGRHDEGEILVSPADKATLVLTRGTGTDMHTASITTTKTLMASDRITVAYRNVMVPDVDPRSDVFETRVLSGTGDIALPGARLDSSPVVGIGQAPDGSGSIMASINEADAGSKVDMIDFTYTAGGSMSIGAQVLIVVPEGWSVPILENNDGVTDTGETTATGAGAPALAISGNMLTVTLGAPLSSGEQFKITYKNAMAPGAGGSYIFGAKSSVRSGGTLTALSQSPTITVSQVASGSIALTSASGPLTSAAPDVDLGNLVFTFAAGTQMQPGAQVIITIPLGWTLPFVDNDDGVDTAGEVSLTGMADLSVSGGGSQPWRLSATATGTLEAGNTLTFTYKTVTAPSAEATYLFMTEASISAGATTLPLSVQPKVIVRASVAAIAAHAMPTKVFVGDDIAVTVDLWSAAGELAKALGDRVVMLSSSSETASFTDADGNAITSITIADNTSSASATYGDSTAGMATITATSGEMTSSVDVEVKSTIRDLVVDVPIARQGSTFTVSATGKGGGGTVTLLDSEGEKVGTKKALDPIGDVDPDGDQEYSRSVTLPAVLEDGMYTVSVEIQGDVNNELTVQVLNDQTPPTISDADASEAVVVNGDTLTLSADVAMNESMVAIASVIADIGGLDSTQTTVALDELSSSPGKYFTIITVDDANEAEDGEYTITITATDAIGNTGSDTVMVTLENDPSELNSAEVTPASGKPGETIWIKATGSEGGSPEATVNNSDSGMMIAQVTLEEEEGNAGNYVAGLMIVEDAHPVGVYDVTVTLGTKMMTLSGALTIVPPGYEFTLDIPAGRSMIHIPLAVAQVNGVDMEINTVRDVFSALGDAVGFITTLADDGVTFNSYLGDDAPGSAFGDTAIGDDTGLIVNMTSAMTLALKGDALGSGGSATMNLRAGLNLVGVPLQTGILPTLSAAINHPVFAGITHIVIMDENGQFQNVLAGTATDGPLMGGTGYFVIASAALALPVSGVAWENDGGSGSSAAPVVLNASTTSVLHVQGRLIDEVGMMSLDGLNVSFKNLSSGTVLGSTVATDDYSMTFVKIDTTAAKVGDILEINADSGNPLLGVRPVQHVVTAADVLNGSISLPDLVSYEIPAQSELLANYPNPFNPETWIPYRLAEDASVSVTIYGASGSLVRTIDVGFTPAAVYEGRSDAIYWDGRNNFGEQVSSGIYFYHLNAGDFSATRKMVIVK